MTPLQVIMLAYKMRQAQQAFRLAARGESPLMDRHSVMADLEDQFDAAIQPYVDYYRNMEGIDNGG